MHGSSGGSGPGKKARIEIIPLIDVIFFLLATFVLFTLALTKSNGIQVTLPATASAVPRNPENSVTISVTKDGNIAWNKDDNVTLEQFISKITEYRASHPDGKVMINGDEDATFSQAVYVFDQVRRAGFDKVYIETRVKDTKK